MEKDTAIEFEDDREFKNLGIAITMCKRQASKLPREKREKYLEKLFDMALTVIDHFNKIDQRENMKVEK